MHTTIPLADARDLDKFYTNPAIAKVCGEEFYHNLMLSRRRAHYKVVEPSAGAGAFDDFVDRAFDLAPDNDNIVQADFLDLDAMRGHLGSGKPVLFLGNPPFGKKGALAVAFINQALQLGSHAGFILPIQFRKWSAQKRLDARAKLIADIDLPEGAFTLCGKPYRVRCCFQIWSRASIDLQRNQRIKTAPRTTHPDFEMWQFNRTEQAERYFHYDWDFAVPRQGYADYGFRALNPSECDRRKQWIFFKAHGDVARDRLMALDFVALSQKNTTVPGFGKADVVAAYSSAYEPRSRRRRYRATA